MMWCVRSYGLFVVVVVAGDLDEGVVDIAVVVVDGGGGAKEGMVKVVV